MASRLSKTFQTAFGSVPHEEERGQDNTKNVIKKGSEASRLNEETKVEQRDETDDAISDFKTLLQDTRLAARKGFQDLKEKCASIKLPALQMAKEEDFFCNELQFDWTSQELLPPDKGTMYRALNTTTDGNCFFRTASILAFGNERNHEEMRVRTVIELACNSDFYLEGEDIERMLIAEAQALEGEAPDLHSNKGGPTSILGPEALRGIFETEVRHSTRERFWACHWHLQALATVLNRQVRSVYPEGGGKEIKKYLNTLILPRCCDKSIKMEEPVAVMWTQTTRSDPFKPNHFVPLIPVNKIPPNKAEDPPTRKLNDPPLPSEKEYKSLSNQNGPPSVPLRGPVYQESEQPGKVRSELKRVNEGPPSVPLRGPIYQESEEAGKVRSELKRVNEGSLVKEIIYGNPFVLDELRLKLDSAPVKKSGLIGYWPHFAYCLGVSDETRMQCQKRSNYTPSLMMFTHLSTKSPDFTVNNLEYHLEEIKRGNLVSKLKKSSVKGTERLTVLSQRDWKTFHEICLYLDCANIYNWQDLSAKMNIPHDIFEKCKRPEEYFEFALQIIYTRRPNLSVKEMKAALEDMDRNDVLEKLKVLPGGSDIKTLLESCDVLQEVSRLLEKETPQNWQVFAQKFGVSKEECDYLCPEDCHSPTEALMEYLSADKEDLTLQTFIEALLQIPREDVLNSLKKFFDLFDIDRIVNNIKLRGLGSNNESETAKQTNSSKLLQVSSESDIL